MDLPVGMGTLAVVSGAIGVVVLWLEMAFGKDRGSRSLFRSVPLRSIHEARDGEVVRIVGKVAVDERALRAPSDDAECVYFHVSFTAARPMSNVTPARTAAPTEVQRACSFWLDCEGARVHVSAKRMVVHEGSPSIFRNATRDDASPGVRAVLDELGQSEVGPYGFSYLERRLVVGTRVAVLGVARWKDVRTTEGYRGRTDRQLSIVGGDNRVEITSDPECLR